MTAVDANTIADQLDGCRCTDLADALDDAGETLADLRTALLNAETERDAAQAEVARLQAAIDAVNAICLGIIAELGFKVTVDGSNVTAVGAAS